MKVRASFERRLLGFARPYRRDAALGATFSVLNKVFDVLPELLIGVAVDVVVNQKASFLATQLGIVDPTRQQDRQKGRFWRMPPVECHGTTLHRGGRSNAVHRNPKN